MPLVSGYSPKLSLLLRDSNCPQIRFTIQRLHLRPMRGACRWQKPESGEGEISVMPLLTFSPPETPLTTGVTATIGTEEASYLSP